MVEWLSERVGYGQSTLVCSTPPSDAGADVSVTRLFPTDGPRQSALWIGFAGVPTERVRAWLSAVSSPSDVAVVSMGDRSVEEIRDVDGLEDPTLETVSSPGDLTGLGITIQMILDGWTGAIGLCFDSLTSLLQYADLETVYEFLHVLIVGLNARDVNAHFHIDPDAHRDQTVHALASLMDSVVHLDDGDGWTVDTRLPNRA